MKRKIEKIKVKSDLTSKLRTVVKNKKVGVFIDAANLYYAATSVGIYVSFESISEWLNKYAANVELNFYTAYDIEDEKQLKFLEELEKHGYRIIKKPVKVFSNLRKGNMDIELAVDALTMSDNYDIFVLMSGDGDFHYLLNTLEEKGKKTVILSIGGFTSFELHQKAGNYFFLDRIAGVWRGLSSKKKEEHEYHIFVDEIDEKDYNLNHKKSVEFQAPLKKEITKAKPQKKVITKTKKTQKPKGNKKPKVKVKVGNKKSTTTIHF